MGATIDVSMNPVPESDLKFGDRAIPVEVYVGGKKKIAYEIVNIFGNNERARAKLQEAQNITYRGRKITEFGREELLAVLAILQKKMLRDFNGHMITDD